MLEYRNPIFEQLLRSGLPIDWTVLRVGLGPYLTESQLHDYAMDQLEFYSGEELNILIELVTPFAGWTIDWCLERLASEHLQDIERAKRVWRWVLFDDYEKKLCQITLDLTKNPPLDDPYWLDEFATHAYCELRDLQTPFAELLDQPPPFSMSTNDLVAMRDMLRKYRSWLECEEVDIRKLFPS